MSLLLFPFILTILALVTANPLPVVVMHGIYGQATDWNNLKTWVQSDFPGTYVKLLEIGENPKKDSTFVDFNIYLEKMAGQIKEDEQLKDGFVFVGHSQGGLLARAYVEMYNDPPVKRLLTLSSPHAGIYCAPNGGCWVPLDPEFINFVEYLVSEFMYTSYFQDNLAASAYWRDPYHLKEYYSECRGLPYYNNELDYNDEYKNNFMSLDKVKLIWSDNDEIILPNESAIFQYFKNNTEELYEFEETPLFKQDLIGLRTLYEEGKVEITNSHMLHNGYKDNYQFYEDEIKDFIHVEG